MPSVETSNPGGTNHHNFVWEPIHTRRAIMPTAAVVPVVAQPPQKEAEKNTSIRWGTKVSVDENLPGKLQSDGTGFRWTATPGYHFEKLSLINTQWYYALVGPDGRCEIVTADHFGLKRAVGSTIPHEVMVKALRYSGGPLSK